MLRGIFRSVFEEREKRERGERSFRPRGDYSQIRTRQSRETRTFGITPGRCENVYSRDDTRLGRVVTSAKRVKDFYEQLPENTFPCPCSRGVERRKEGRKEGEEGGMVGFASDD